MAPSFCYTGWSRKPLLSHNTIGSLWYFQTDSTHLRSAPSFFKELGSKHRHLNAKGLNLIIYYQNHRQGTQQKWSKGLLIKMHALGLLICRCTLVVFTVVLDVCSPVYAFYDTLFQYDYFSHRCTIYFDRHGFSPLEKLCRIFLCAGISLDQHVQTILIHISCHHHRC